MEGQSGWRTRSRRLADRMLDLVLPPVCGNCRRPGALFCDECLAAVAWLQAPVCEQCGRPQQQPVSRCHLCREEPPATERIRCATLHAGSVRPMIHAMKYDGYFALAQPLAELMVSAWPRWQMAADIVVPIALHADRQRERGYNQAELLGRHLAQAIGLDFDAEALARTRRTRPQVGLGRHERRANVRDAFTALPGRAAGRRILLVDDVCTSGATLSAAAGVLLAAGALSVSAYCLAAAVDGDQGP